MRGTKGYSTSFAPPVQRNAVHRTRNRPLVQRERCREAPETPSFHQCSPLTVPTEATMIEPMASH
jgi:hypothetical protein